LDVIDDIASKLKMLGLREYEARVYAALVILGPSKASEIAKESGVPRPRVYEVLKELHRKGFVDVSEGTPTYFRAVDPNEVIAALRDKYLRTAEEVMVRLRSYQREQGEWLPIWYLRGEWSIRSKVEGMVERAERELLAAVTEPELILKFRKALEEGRERGLDVKIVVLRRGRGKRLKLLKQLGEVYPVTLEQVLEGEERYRTLIEALFRTTTPCSIKGILMRDGKESIMIYEEKGVLKALTVELPIIPVFQRMIILHMISKAKTTQSNNQSA